MRCSHYHHYPHSCSTPSAADERQQNFGEFFANFTFNSGTIIENMQMGYYFPTVSIAGSSVAPALGIHPYRPFAIDGDGTAMMIMMILIIMMIITQSNTVCSSGGITTSETAGIQSVLFSFLNT